MVKIFVCELILCMILCGCGTGKDSHITVIGQGRGGQAAVSDQRAGIVGSGTIQTAESGTGVPDETADSGNGSKTEESGIRVHVCGAVKSPGVVSLPEDSRAEDALNAAGGFADNAWRDYVNLAEKVRDGEKLYFPTLEETESLIVQDSAGNLVNINTADAAALCTLPGIGESRASDIIAYREANGPFDSCEDIMKVPGIKTSVYSKISDKITVR